MHLSLIGGSCPTLGMHLESELKKYVQGGEFQIDAKVFEDSLHGRTDDASGSLFTSIIYARIRARAAPGKCRRADETRTGACLLCNGGRKGGYKYQLVEDRYQLVTDPAY